MIKSTRGKSDNRYEPILNHHPMSARNGQRLLPLIQLRGLAAKVMAGNCVLLVSPLPLKPVVPQKHFFYTERQLFTLRPWFGLS